MYPKIEPQDFITISLAKAITLDTMSLAMGQARVIKATALSGKWLYDATKSTDAPPMGFAATRAYAGEVAHEIGELIDPDAPVSVDEDGGKRRVYVLYGTGNRSPLYVDVAKANVIAEAPARY